jgi:hypothetical protein
MLFFKDVIILAVMDTALASAPMEVFVSFDATLRAAIALIVLAKRSQAAR